MLTPRAATMLGSAVLCVAPFVVQWPYLELPHAFDDWLHFKTLAREQLGELTLDGYLLTPVNEHLLPAWRIWYLACWQVFGLSPTGWHVTITVAHGVGAMLLFVALRGYLGAAAAFFAAFLWSTCGVGSWENPLAWIAASHLTFGLTALLGAMACMAQVRSSDRLLWPALMAVCATMAVLWMSAMWALLPVLAVQWWLLERRPGEPHWPRRSWLLAGAVPFVALSPLALAGAFGYFGRTLVDTNDGNIVTGLLRTAAAWGMCLGRMVYPTAWSLPDPSFVVRVAAGVALLAAVFFVPRVDRRVLVVFLGLTLVYTALVQISRSGSDAAYSLAMGRYYYVAMLGWCVVWATWIPPLTKAAGAGRYAWVTSVLLVVAALHVWQQSRLVQNAAEKYELATRLNTINFDDSARLIAQIGDAARARSRPVRLLNVTWRCPPVDLTLRELLTLMKADRAEGLELVAAKDWTPADLATARDLLAHHDNAMRATIEDALATQSEVARFVVALDAQGRASDRVIRFPDIELTLRQPFFIGAGPPHALRGPQDPDFSAANIPYKFSALASALCIEPATHVQFFEADDGDIAAWTSALDELARIDLPVAAQLRTAIQEQIKAASMLNAAPPPSAPGPN